MEQEPNPRRVHFAKVNSTKESDEGAGGHEKRLNTSTEEIVQSRCCFLNVYLREDQYGKVHAMSFLEDGLLLVPLFSANVPVS